MLIITQDDPTFGVITALSDNPGSVLHQDRETPLRTDDQEYDVFFTDSGGLVCRASKGETEELLKDPRIYGK